MDHHSLTLFYYPIALYHTTDPAIDLATVWLLSGYCLAFSAVLYCCDVMQPVAAAQAPANSGGMAGTLLALLVPDMGAYLRGALR